MKISPITFVFGIGVLLVLGIAGYLTFGPKPAPPPEPVMTQEAKDYMGNLDLGNVHMQASESFTNQRVIEILGDITNHGNRAVKQALVTCVFFDWGGQIIARENDYIVGGAICLLAARCDETLSSRLQYDSPKHGPSNSRPSSFAKSNFNEVAGRRVSCQYACGDNRIEFTHDDSSFH